MITDRIRALRLLQLRYAASLLRDYMDNDNPSGLGIFTIEALGRAPQVHPEMQERYFEIFGALPYLLSRNSELTIQSAYSIAYTANRIRQQFAVCAWLTEFENDSRLVESVRLLWTWKPEPVEISDTACSTDVPEDVDIFIPDMD